MTAHCATCNCADDDRPPQPSTSSAWARRQALEAAAAAVTASREKRTKPSQDRTRYETHIWSPRTDGDEDDCMACGVTWQDCEGECTS